MKKNAMTLKDCKDWKAIHFADRAILKVDKPFFSNSQWQDILNLPVEMMGIKGHYKVSE